MKNVNIITLCLAFLFITGCSKNDSAASMEVSEKTKLQIALNYKAPPSFDSLVIHGEGTDTIHYNLDSRQESLDIEVFPALWNFKARLYSNGILVQQGEAEIEVLSEQMNYLQLHLKALVGFINVTIPLGLGNQAGIQGGKLILQSDKEEFSYDLQIRESFGYFTGDALPLNKWYSVSLELFDANGDILYHTNDSLYLDQENAAINWSLTSLKGTLSISILQDPIDTTMVNVAFTGRDKKKPQIGDAIFSEFLAIPQAGSNFEFIEFYNATLDTLILDNCIVRLKASSNSGNITLPEGSILLPASYITFGADSTNFIHTDSWYTNGLTNTRAAITLVCDNMVIDSIAYSVSAEQGSDSIAIKSSSSTHLDLSYWEIHDKGKAWCLGESTPNYASSCYVEEDNSGENEDFR